MNRIHGAPLLPALCVLVLVFALSVPALAAGEREGTSASSNMEVLDWAYRAASTIDLAHDRGGAQRAVLKAYVAADEIDEALKRSHTVAGWHRGVAYADLAADLARAGRATEARSFIARAEEVRRTVTGWQGPRISVHIGSAYVALGDEERAERILGIAAENDPGEYSGRAAATLAAADIRSGHFDQAMAALGEASEEGDFHNAWWRARGYLDLAQRTELSREQRLEALRAARLATGETVGNKKLDLMRGIAAAYRDLDEPKTSREVLKIVDGWVIEAAARSPTGSARIVDLARSWHAMGDVERGRELLAKAEAGVRRATLTEQPTLCAKIGSAYRLFGEEEKARELYNRAFDLTGLIASPRPRAISLVAVCLALAEDGVPLDAGLRSRIETLFGGLG
jgi:tetratricopeptide (TPR) repeat protein